MADFVPAGAHMNLSVDPSNISFNDEEESEDAAEVEGRKELLGGGRREVGDQDQVWSLSTAKPGNGVEQLRDGDLETYWQCDSFALRALRSARLTAHRSPLASPPVRYRCDSARPLLRTRRSDGPQPHLVNIQFHKKTRVKEIEIYTEYTKDESYTPANISVVRHSFSHFSPCVFREP